MTDVLELNETFKTVDEQLNAIHQNLSNLFQNKNATVKLLGKLVKISQEKDLSYRAEPRIEITANRNTLIILFTFFK